MNSVVQAGRGYEMDGHAHNSRSETPTSDFDTLQLEQEEMLDKVGAPPLTPGGKFNKAKPMGKTYALNFWFSERFGEVLSNFSPHPKLANFVTHCVQKSINSYLLPSLGTINSLIA